MATKNQKRRELNDQVSWALAHIETQTHKGKKLMAHFYLQMFQAQLQLMTLDGRKKEDKAEHIRLTKKVKTIQTAMANLREKAGGANSLMLGDYSLRVEDLAS